MKPRPFDHIWKLEESLPLVREGRSQGSAPEDNSRPAPKREICRHTDHWQTTELCTNSQKKNLRPRIVEIGYNQPVDGLGGCNGNSIEIQSL